MISLPFLITALINDFDPYMNSPIFKNMNKVNSKNAKDMKLAAELEENLVISVSGFISPTNTILIVLIKSLIRLHGKSSTT